MLPKKCEYVKEVLKEMRLNKKEAVSFDLCEPCLWQKPQLPRFSEAQALACESQVGRSSPTS